jgi:WXG100 family type VII secretion target
MASTRVSTSELRGAADTVEQFAGDYMRQVQSLFDAGRELDQMWNGDANDSFNAQMGQDQPRFEALNTVVGQYVQGLRTSADLYDKAEMAALQTLSTKTVRNI